MAGSGDQTHNSGGFFALFLSRKGGLRVVGMLLGLIFLWPAFAWGLLCKAFGLDLRKQNEDDFARGANLGLCAVLTLLWLLAIGFGIAKHFSQSAQIEF